MRAQDMSKQRRTKEIGALLSSRDQIAASVVVDDARRKSVVIIRTIVCSLVYLDFDISIVFILLQFEQV